MMQAAPRALRADERAVIASLCALNGVAIPDTATLDALMVVGHCECGCASIDFEVNAPGSAPYAEGYGTTADGIEVGLILWEREKRLAGLEVYMLGEDTPDFPLPGSLHRGEGAPAS